jgi:adenylate kinase
MNIIFLGPQSSGKGTQAGLLAKKLGIPTLTVGHILRKKKAQNDEEGKMIASFLDAGELLPNEITDNLVREELRGEKYAKGFILDGYPRNAHQANHLEEFVKIDKAVFLDVPDGVVMQRILNRLVCDNCGENYNLLAKPPKVEGVCDECGGKLAARADDTKEAIAKRLNIYHTETKPLIEHYRSKGMLLHVNGAEGIEAVHQEIMQNINQNI